MIRAAIKFLGFLWISARALVTFCFLADKTAVGRASWGHRWAKAYLALLNVELTWKGTPPAKGLLTCNHLSYLDIVVLSAVRPQIFLSKAEVRGWPIIGALASCAGTLFVRRDRKADVADLQGEFEGVFAQKLPITLFPEGTSSNGAQVLPFFSSLLEPAARGGWEVTPGWIGYRLDEGSVADDVCYWGDMTFGPHFLKLLSKKKIYATIVYGDALASGMNRKEMATALHREVSGMAVGNRRGDVAESALELVDV